MFRNFIKTIISFIAALSLNVMALEVFTASDYNVESGNSVTLTFHDWSPSYYWPQVFNIYVTKPGSSGRVVVQTGVRGSNFTHTLIGAGTHYLEIEVCDTDTGACGSESSLQIVVTPSSLPKPVININYPAGIYAGDTFKLEVTTSHAIACTIKYTASGAPQSIGNYLKIDRFTYASPGTYVQSVACDGPGGSSTKNHTVNVFTKNPPAGPQIRSFLNGDVINGQTTLFWNSTNTDRCTLNNGSVNAPVATSGIGYPASVPFGGLTFTLSCYQGNSSVSKELYVPRPSFNQPPCGRFCDLSIEPANTNAASLEGSSIQNETTDSRKIFILENHDALSNLGINLLAPEATFNTPDLNGDGFVDLVVYLPTQQLAHVLLNNSGSFGTINATTKSLNDRQLINAIRIDDEGKVTLEVTPNMIIDQ